MLYTAFVLGLLGSFHCIGMCGPIAFVLPVDKTSRSKAFLGSFLYHFGRLLTYGIIGILFGLLGRGLGCAGDPQRCSRVQALICVHFGAKRRWSARSA